MYMADSMGLMYASQACQMLGYGLMFPAMVSFIDDIMTKGEAVRGQAVFTTAVTVETFWDACSEDGYSMYPQCRRSFW